MKLSEVELPSNRRFGFFLVAILWIAAAYSFYVNSTDWLYIIGTIGSVFLIVAIIKPVVLLPLNRLWMMFGLFIGMIVSPIVLGVIFFGIFTPIAIFMRLFRRDELCLKFKEKKTHWIRRDAKVEHESFKNQF